MNTENYKVSSIDPEIKLTIAIVDDNQPDHFFIKSSLSGFKNIRFLSFYNGEEYVNFLTSLANKSDLAEDDCPDIVILDINMPKLNGFEVFEASRNCKVNKNIYYTILSTSITPPDKEKCEKFRLECNVKPFAIEKFRLLLQSIISTYQAKQ